MDKLLEKAVLALGENQFRQHFVEFLMLQRYDLLPYVELFGTLDNIGENNRFELTVGDKTISAHNLVEQYVNFITRNYDGTDVRSVADEFHHEFFSAIDNGGPDECRIARESLDKDYELNFMMPLLRPALADIEPLRVLDFGCGMNQLGRVLQQEFFEAGLSIPEIIGVDMHDSKDVTVDSPKGVYYYNLRKQELEAVVKEPVDLVFVKYVLHHMSAQEQQNIVERLASILKPGGRLIVLEASVGTDELDFSMFEKAVQTHPSWPNEKWAAPYHEWSRNFYKLDAKYQSMLMCLEDAFGHLFLCEKNQMNTEMPLPYTYISRNELIRFTQKSDLHFEPELSAVVGLPPSLKYGPPSTIMSFTSRPCLF